MDTFMQEARSPCHVPMNPLPAWSRWQSAGMIDPVLDRAMALARLGAWSCNLSNERLSWTSGIYDIFGLPLDCAVDRRETLEMYTEESRHTLNRLRGHAIATGCPFTLDARIRRPDGEFRWLRIDGEMIRHANGTRILHGMKQDVTEDKLRAEALRRLAETDALTGLSNRAVFEARFLNRGRGNSPAPPLGALVLFDLDGFKEINDRLGHLAGDACLRAFAERLSTSFPHAMLSARIGGDEFALIFGMEEPKACLKGRVAAFLERLRAPISWREHLLTIDATSGIAVPREPHAYDPEELFVTADSALYAAKRARQQASGKRPAGMLNQRSA